MDSYNVIISPKALAQLESYIDYIQYTLFNDQAAKAVWDDAVETVSQLGYMAKKYLLMAFIIRCRIMKMCFLLI